MSLVGWFKGTGPSGFGYDATADEVTEGLDVSDHTVLITGANTGLGYETARALADRGARVLAAARSARKAERTCESLPGATEPVVCELSEPGSIRACTGELRERGVALDAIVANAGIMTPPELQTKFGYELQFLVNHVGHYLLVTDLLDLLRQRGRVVVLSSDAHRRTPKQGIDFDNLDGSRGYDPRKFYGQSKLANLLFAKELHRRFERSPDGDRVAFAVHPGLVQTEIVRNLSPSIQSLIDVVGPLVMKDVRRGAATQTWAAVHPDARTYGGGYLVDCNPAEPSKEANDPQLARRLWEKTDEIVRELVGSETHSTTSKA